ncbi:MAG: PQQ-binding-like beta-propeller repeat protein [Rhodospirillales bacterium]|jgi:PQQ-dependent dehydrogenase (methanol/ethanol family)|nr:PQQ-binding-like beta-propeller repeat protein [Rhodospirillales bacterium]
MSKKSGIPLSASLLACVFYACAGAVGALAPAHAGTTDNAATPGTTRGVGSAVGVDVNVSDQQLMNASRNLDNWMLYGRTYKNQRFSPLKQVNADNVKALQPVAIIQTGVAASFENSPIVVNGIMYVSTPWDHVIAYDATNGKQLWSYTASLGYTQLCCGPESRGVAVADGKVYLATLDAHLIALNAATGKVEWNTQVADSRAAFSLTMAPQVYDGMVIVGSSGAEFPTRGFVAAYSGSTGKQIWRFHTIAAPGEPGGNSWSGDSWKTGGGSMWNTPAIDPKRGLIVFGVGNPNPDNYGGGRKGDNAYTDSIVALHVKTGKLAWWYQEVKHDLWDYDADAPVVLLHVKDAQGQDIAAAAEAGKEGQVFFVNRDNGHLIRKSEPFVEQSANMYTTPPAKGYVNIYPGAQGGNEWSPEAYSPKTRLFYVDGTNESWEYTAEKPDQTVVGHLRLGSVLQPITKNGAIALGEPGAGRNQAHTKGAIQPTGTLSAVDVDSGKIAWQYASHYPMLGGVLATGGNLVFAGEMNGDFDAFNAQTGQKLWHFQLGAGVNAPPVTYRVNGTQYVAVAAGGNAANGNPVLMKELGLHFGDGIAIFALNDQVARK